MVTNLWTMLTKLEKKGVPNFKACGKCQEMVQPIFITIVSLTVVRGVMVTVQQNTAFWCTSVTIWKTLGGRLNNCLKFSWHFNGSFTLRDGNQWLPLLTGATSVFSRHKWSQGLPNMLSREQKPPLWIWLAGTISPNPKSVNNGTPASWCSSIKCMPSCDMGMKATIPTFLFFFIWAMVSGL